MITNRIQTFGRTAPTLKYCSSKGPNGSELVGSFCVLLKNGCLGQLRRCNPIFGARNAEERTNQED